MLGRINKWPKLAFTSYKRLNNRFISVVAKKLVYSEFGEPVDVVKLEEHPLPPLSNDEVLVKMLASPINPADMNTIQGRYPVKPNLPAVGGNECVGEVLDVGDNVSKLSVGDRVVPYQTGIGTWTTHAIYKATSLKRVPKDLGILEACTINVNPPTAYRMLKDFVDLRPGDTVIQNGANSAVGQAIFQLCREWNLNCVGIVRDRPQVKELQTYLKSLGAAEVLTEEQIRTTQIFKGGLLKPPRLGLNCVGGKSSTEMIRHLGSKSVMVTYGGMSREPVTVPTSALIFKDIAFHGFWMTRWSKENHNSPARDLMFDQLIKMMMEKRLKGPVAREIPFLQFKEGLANALSFQGFIGEKFVLRFD